MIVYRYKPSDVSMEKFEAAYCRLVGDDVQYTEDPAQADVLLMPVLADRLGLTRLRALPYREHGGKVVVMCIGDYMNDIVGIGYSGLFFRSDATKKVTDADPSTIPWPWPVDNLTSWYDKPFECDVSFCGWLSSAELRTAISSLDRSGLLCSIMPNKGFYGYMTEQQQADLRGPFLESMAAGRLNLCVRTFDGAIRYRFYEAMSMGRCIIHVNDNCNYPFAGKIDYDRFVIRVRESDACNIGYVAKNTLASLSDWELRERGKYAQEMWRTYLDREKWAEIMTDVVREKIA